MAKIEKFDGDCKVLQDLLRRFVELQGGEVQELPNNTISCDMKVIIPILPEFEARSIEQ